MTLVVFVFQEKIDALQVELQAVTNSKSMLEKELQEVISLTSTELEEYQEKVLELEDEVSSDHSVSWDITSSRCQWIYVLISPHSFKSHDASRNASGNWKTPTRSSRWSWSMKKGSLLDWLSPTMSCESTPTSWSRLWLRERPILSSSTYRYIYTHNK